MKVLLARRGVPTAFHVHARATAGARACGPKSTRPSWPLGPPPVRDSSRLRCSGGDAARLFCTCCVVEGAATAPEVLPCEETRSEVDVSVRARVDPAPDGCARRAIAKPRSRSAMASVPRYMCRCARRLIGGSVQVSRNGTSITLARLKKTYQKYTPPPYVSRA